MIYNVNKTISLKTFQLASTRHHQLKEYKKVELFYFVGHLQAQIQEKKCTFSKFPGFPILSNVSPIFQ